MEKKAVGQLMGGRWEWRGDGWRECKTSREAALKTASRMHKRSVKAALST